MSIISLFFPAADQEKLPVAVRKRIPLLISANLVLALFFLVASFTRFREDPEKYLRFFVAVVSTDVSFFLSLVLIRLRAYRLASWLASLGMILNATWTGIFLPYTQPADLYRYGMYVIGAVLANNLFSLRTRQLVFFGASTLVSFFVVLFLFMIPALGDIRSEGLTIAIVIFIFFVLASVIVLFQNRYSGDLINLAEEEKRRTEEKAQQLENLIGGAKGSLEIGKVLKSASMESLSAGESMKRSLDELNKDAMSLKSDAAQTDDTNKDIVRYTREMTETVRRQNAALNQASAAITEIMATIQSIADLAQKRKSTIDRVLSNAEEQGLEINKVTEGLSRILEAFVSVRTVASGIMDVSEKTNLLAMNASIEAAHAGNSGRGFAVISAEIRKLSDETKVNTESIGKALENNREIVNEATEIVRRFTSNIQGIISDVRETFNAIDQIIDGLAEISQATGDLTRTTGEMLSMAQSTDAVVHNVSTKIESGSSSVEKISGFSALLHGKVTQIVQNYGLIESTLSKVNAIGDKNIVQMGVLEKEISRITST